METFNQTRSILCAYSPISSGNQCVFNGDVLPDPWSLPCTPNEMFVNHRKLINLPNTDMIQVGFILISFKVILFLYYKN